MTLVQLQKAVTHCRRCDRLRDHCTTVASEKRKAYRDWDYWGRPVSGFGDPDARLWIIGLAPGAHGANRTGRVFTGDRSGDFLFSALHRAGIANQSTSVSQDDGLRLRRCYISIAARCAPPGNRPSPVELSHCAEYLDVEWKQLKQKRAILALGGVAWQSAIALAKRNGCDLRGAATPFSHGATCRLNDRLVLVGSYHVSQQNTFTRRLTPAMFDQVLSFCLTSAAAGLSRTA